MAVVVGFFGSVDPEPDLELLAVRLDLQFVGQRVVIGQAFEPGDVEGLLPRQTQTRSCVAIGELQVR